MFVDSDANFRSAAALSGSHPAVTISVVLDRVELAGRPLKIEHSEVVLADGFRRQLAQRCGGAGGPPIEKRADFGVKLGHGTALPLR